MSAPTCRRDGAKTIRIGGSVGPSGPSAGPARHGTLPVSRPPCQSPHRVRPVRPLTFPSYLSMAQAPRPGGGMATAKIQTTSLRIRSSALGAAAPSTLVNMQMCMPMAAEARAGRSSPAARPCAPSTGVRSPIHPTADESGCGRGARCAADCAAAARPPAGSRSCRKHYDACPGGTADRTGGEGRRSGGRTGIAMRRTPTGRVLRGGRGNGRAFPAPQCPPSDSSGGAPAYRAIIQKTKATQAAKQA